MPKRLSLPALSVEVVELSDSVGLRSDARTEAVQQAEEAFRGATGGFEIPAGYLSVKDWMENGLRLKSPYLFTEDAGSVSNVAPRIRRHDAEGRRRTAEELLDIANRNLVSSKREGQE